MNDTAVTGSWETVLGVGGPPVEGILYEFETALSAFQQRRDHVQVVADGFRPLADPGYFDGHLHPEVATRLIDGIAEIDTTMTKLVQSADEAQAIFESHHGRLASLHDEAELLYGDAVEAANTQQSLQARIDSGTAHDDIEGVRAELDAANARLSTLRETYWELQQAESALNDETGDALASISVSSPFDTFVDILGVNWSGTANGLSDFFSSIGGVFADIGTAWSAVAKPTVFSEFVAGKGANTIDQDLAQIASDVYDIRSASGNEPTAQGWTRASSDQLAAMGLTYADLEDPLTGFRADVYVRNGEYVLAFAGTNDPLGDVAANVQQGVGVSNEQYEQALAIATKVQDGVGSENLVMTGHSLGGGLASYAALGTGSPAVTFNAAGLSDASVEQATGGSADEGRAAAANGQVRAYRTSNDLLTELQEEAPGASTLPDAVGNPVTLGSPSETDYNLLDWLSPANFATKAVVGHGGEHTMDAVNDGLDRDMAHLLGSGG